MLAIYYKIILIGWELLPFIVAMGKMVITNNINVVFITFIVALIVDVASVALDYAFHFLHYFLFKSNSPGFVCVTRSAAC